VLAVFALMTATAAHIVRSRVGERTVTFFKPTLVAMFVSYMAVTVVVTAVIVGARPWWTPQYFLPLGGMVIGNSMNALAIALERLFSGLRRRREEIEMMLSMGADAGEAGKKVVREAMKAGMIPSINSMMGVGIVFIPGMMTGQIVAGADPLVAVRYQIMVMLMLVASTAISTVVVVFLVRNRCFDAADRLVLPREG
jgi:putative ABC transport system permease protein